MEKQIITEDYAIYNDDCMRVLRELPDEKIDFSVYSPPFAGLYNYSSDPRDFSNCESKEQFLDQYRFLINEIARLTRPGRITAVHCTDVMNSKTEALWDFPHEIIRMHTEAGFVYRNRVTVWKEPLEVRMRTMVKSLMHKLIVEDSTQSFPAMPDYILIFKRKGENQIPVTHERGFTRYAGLTPMLPDMVEKYGKKHGTWKEIVDKYKDHDDPKTNKMSHLIWQRYASSVWDDIRVDEVLPYVDMRTEDGEKHVHPLQLDVIDRLVDLYSNPGEVVLSPFAGVGSEIFSAVSMGRKAIGAELKDTYFAQMVENMKKAKTRFKEDAQMTI